jgi:hypothetical protein
MRLSIFLCFHVRLQRQAKTSGVQRFEVKYETADVEPELPGDEFTTILEGAVIQGRAKEKSTQVVSVRLPLPQGAHAEINIPIPCVKVPDMRVDKQLAYVTVEVESQRSATMPYTLVFHENSSRITCRGRVEIQRPIPFILGLSAVIGYRKVAEVPVKSGLTETREWTASFYPEQPGLTLTKSGTISFGMRE